MFYYYFQNEMNFSDFKKKIYQNRILRHTLFRCLDARQGRRIYLIKTALYWWLTVVARSYILGIRHRQTRPVAVRCTCRFFSPRHLLDYENKNCYYYYFVHTYISLSILFETIFKTITFRILFWLDTYLYNIDKT